MAGTLTIHYGLPRTGKTLFAVQDIIVPAVRENRPFFTNISGISLSGLSAVSGIHQSLIKYYFVRDISDVIDYYADSKTSHDGVFILDEMKDFVDNEKSVSWLETRINLMGKNGIDFVLIAQLPKKEYIHPNIIELAMSSNVFVRRFSLGDKTHTDEYFIDGGLPKILNKVPSNSVGKKTRLLDPVYFSCYKTSENAFYEGKENDSYKGLMWWQTRKAKFRFFIAFIVLVVVVLAVFSLKTLFSFTEPKRGSNSNEKESISAVSFPEENESSNDESCYKFIICDDAICETDIGKFPLFAYKEKFNMLCLNNNCFNKCPPDSAVPD